MSLLRGHFRRQALVTKGRSEGAATAAAAAAVDRGTRRRNRVTTTPPEHRRRVLDAIRKGNVRMLLQALRAARDANVLGAATRTNEGVPCIFLAIETGMPQLVKLLLNWGAPVNLSLDVYDGRSMLLHAAARSTASRAQEAASVVKVLLEAGCDVHAKDARGRTALMMAAYKKNEEMMATLLEHGASLDDSDRRGSHAKAWASRGFDKPTADPFLDDDGALFEHINDGAEALDLLEQ